VRLGFGNGAALGAKLHAFTHGTSCSSRHKLTSLKCPKVRVDKATGLLPTGMSGFLLLLVVVVGVVAVLTSARDAVDGSSTGT
jgi:hypothetical protein